MTKCPYQENTRSGMNSREQEESYFVIQKFQFAFFFVTVEADEEMKEKEARGLNEDETTDRPSEVMSALDKGLSAIANLVTDEVDM